MRKIKSEQCIKSHLKLCGCSKGHLGFQCNVMDKFLKLIFYNDRSNYTLIKLFFWVFPIVVSGESSCEICFKVLSFDAKEESTKPLKREKGPIQ